MDIKDFLSQFVQGYLFCDLKSMEAIKDAGRYGNCGYSMVLVAFTGIELFGALTFPGGKGADKGGANFVRFWSEYLYAAHPVRRRLGQTVRTLVRDGIGHVLSLNRWSPSRNMD
jgi:hypothetical protein